MTSLNTKYLSISVILLITLVAGIFYFQTLDEPLDPKLESSSQMNRTIEEDELGLSDLTRAFFSGLKQIVDDEGTGTNVINLVEVTEVQLNKTIQDRELTEDQQTMVDNLSLLISKAKDLAQSGMSPDQILEEIWPNKRAN